MCTHTATYMAKGAICRVIVSGVVSNVCARVCVRVCVCVCVCVLEDFTPSITILMTMVLFECLMYACTYRYIMVAVDTVDWIWVRKCYSLIVLYRCVLCCTCQAVLLC